MVVSVGETPVANCECEAMPGTASEDAESLRWRACVAPGRGGALDSVDWAMFSFALLAMTAAVGVAAPGRPFVLGASLVVSAFGGLAGGALADRVARVGC